MDSLPFTVDSALLRELGERLVGKPHIALAELVKNSYDADATDVTIEFNRDSITVIDNGSGMDFEDFRDFWMRIGSPHKEQKTLSDRFNRPLTGSKGVGRLAVQLLANKLEMRTAVPGRKADELYAVVDWSKAVAAGELTKAEAQWAKRGRTEPFAADSRHGTELKLTELHQLWSPEQFSALAQEIWALQPPFADPVDRSSAAPAFRVVLDSPDTATVQRFTEQMGAVLKLWSARITGRLHPDGQTGVRDRTVDLVLEFAGRAPERSSYKIENCHLENVDFQIRVFSLQHRQPYGIKVKEAREYLNQYGGIHIYDGGFRLPYYGVDTDWLRIEFDHAHRLSASKLLPEELQVTDGLNFLPTNSRLFGVVNISSGLESRMARERGAPRQALGIQVTRDRLVDNDAYQDLVRVVRWSLDFYAMNEARRAFEQGQASRDTEPLRQKAERVEEVLDRYKNEIPGPVYEELRTQLREVIIATESEAESLAQQAGLLGALATAGISALAYEHEASKELAELEAVAKALPSAASLNERAVLAGRLDEWLVRAKQMRVLFSSLLTENNREDRRQLRAVAVLEQVGEQLRPLIKDLPIDLSGVRSDFRLPQGTMTEWSALFQNLFVNAANALLDAESPRVRVRSEVRGRRRALYVEDVGVGVDLEKSEELFQPFVRRIELSRNRRALGLGGTGLGLTIVRMIASQLGARVSFVEPPEGFRTSVRVSWGE